MKFIRKAELRRFRGAALNDEMTGSLITYDNSNDVFTVDGGPASPSSPATGGRVRAVLAPKPTASAPAVVAPPPTQLRPSTTLDGSRK